MRLEDQNQGRSNFRHRFWSSYEYLIHYESEDFGAHQMVIQFFLCELLSLEWLRCPEHAT
jgi:hypothetical protein